LVRPQARGGDQAATFELSLPTQEKRGQAFGLPDGDDVVLVSGMLEAIDGFADEEALGAEKRLVDEVDSARQSLRRIFRSRGARCGDDLGGRLRTGRERFRRWIHQGWFRLLCDVFGNRRGGLFD